MDDIYIVSKDRTKTSKEYLHLLMDVIIENKLSISDIFYSDDSSNPIIKINSKQAMEDEFGEEIFPSARISVFDDKNLYDHNNRIEKGSNSYYHVISIGSRDALFLARVSIAILKTSQDFLVCNVENNLQDLDEIIYALNKKDYGWAYR